MLHNATIRLIITLFLGAVAWIFIAYKAFTIPITHDEVATSIHYYKYNVWQIMMYPDPWPSNHILNTLLAKLSMNLFGWEDWAARLPNVLSFGLYFYAAYQICKLLFKNDTLLFFGSIIIFICNPFLLDFFSVCRGYGMSNALMLCSAMFALQGFMEAKERSIWWSFALAILASYANFTLLIFWCAMSGMMLLYFVNEYFNTKNRRVLFKNVGIIIAINIGYLALIYTPIHKMQSTNQFVFWQSNGFFRDTVISLVENSRYGVNILGMATMYYAFIVSLLFFAAGAYAMYWWGKTSRNEILKTPLFIAFAILALTILVNLSQTVILKTPNLTTRTALSYYPLFILLIGSLLYQLNVIKPIVPKILSAVLIIMTIWHLSRAIGFNSVREWWYDANTFQVLDILQSQAKDNSKVTLQTAWQFYRSFEFYNTIGKTPWLDLKPDNQAIDTASTAQYYYIFDSDYALLQNKYDVVRKYDGGARLLLKRRQ